MCIRTCVWQERTVRASTFQLCFRPGLLQKQHTPSHSVSVRISDNSPCKGVFYPPDPLSARHQKRLGPYSWSRQTTGYLMRRACLCCCTTDEGAEKNIEGWKRRRGRKKQKKVKKKSFGNILTNSTLSTKKYTPDVLGDRKNIGVLCSLGP